MSRNLAGVGAVIGVVGLLWIVVAWPVPKDEASALEEPAASIAPLSPISAPTLGAVTHAPAAPEPEPRPEPAAAAEPAADEAPEVREHRHLRTNADGSRELDELFKTDLGPVDEYRKQYQSEPRDFAAADVEAKLRQAFGASQSSEDLIRSLSCRETICKLEMRWSMDRRETYMAGISRSLRIIQPQLAASPVGQKDATGIRTVEVYVKRRPPQPPGAVEPSHQH